MITDYNSNVVDIMLKNGKCKILIIDWKIQSENGIMEHFVLENNKVDKYIECNLQQFLVL